MASACSMTSFMLRLDAVELALKAEPASGAAAQAAALLEETKAAQLTPEEMVVGCSRIATLQLAPEMKKELLDALAQMAHDKKGGRREMQNYEELRHYMEKREQDVLRNPEVNEDVKINMFVVKGFALGCRCASEKSKKAWGHALSMYICGEGHEGPRLHQKINVAWKQLCRRSVAKKNPKEWVNILPQQPSELKEKFPAVHDAVFGPRYPCPCPHAEGALVLATDSQPTRSGRCAYKPQALALVQKREAHAGTDLMLIAKTFMEGMQRSQMEMMKSMNPNRFGQNAFPNVFGGPSPDDIPLEMYQQGKGYRRSASFHGGQAPREAGEGEAGSIVPRVPALPPAAIKDQVVDIASPGAAEGKDAAASDDIDVGSGLKRRLPISRDAAESAEDLDENAETAASIDLFKALASRDAARADVAKSRKAAKVAAKGAAEAAAREAGATEDDAALHAAAVTGSKTLKKAKGKAAAKPKGRPKKVAAPSATISSATSTSAAKAKAGAKTKAGSKGGSGSAKPSYSVEWSRSQVLCRTGVKGEPSTTFKFGSGKGDLEKAVVLAKKWVEARM